MRPSLAFIAAPFALAMLAAPLAMVPASSARAQFGIGVSIAIAPPILPVYVQPPLPAPGYLWTPGFWDYAAEGGYYWVPGTWGSAAGRGSALDAWLLGLQQRPLRVQ